MAYLDLSSTLDAYTDLSVLPAEYAAEVEARYEGWLAAQAAYWSAVIDSRLAKRYDTPFTAPYPVAVTGWLARLLDVRVLLKRGVDATDAQFATVAASGEAVLVELKEAADAVNGLFDLPLRSDTTASGVVRPRVQSYSEQSPYTGARVQRDVARTEYRNGQ